MKCDDDTFVNVPNLLHILLGGTVPAYGATINQFNDYTIRPMWSKNRLMDTQNLLMGSRFCHSKPINNVNSKWYSPLYLFDKTSYPQYLSGIGYVMSTEVATKLYNVSLRTPFFHLEDVFLTGEQ